MVTIIAGIRILVDKIPVETSIVKLSPEEIEAYAWEYEIASRMFGPKMTFERFLQWRGIIDMAYLMERVEDQKMWFEARERELRLREAKPQSYGTVVRRGITL
jgi:hypothetical protein